MAKVSVIVPVYNVENYIRDMLESVQNQKFKDFEVILINDGSPDNSQDIIDEFCHADKRFKGFIQENGGVAAARNSGIEKASGDYLVFYDPDDFIPADALGKMYKTAARNNADIVIGIMEEKSLGESLIYMHSQALAKQKKIDVMDKHFTGAWSLCHKMFCRRLIVDNNIKFEKLSNAEDGVFTYCALNHAENLCGCKVIAYNYMKRPFWLEASATQTISSKYLEGLLASHDRILEEATRLADKHLSGEDRKKYMSELFVRFIEGEMVKGYYRNIWRSKENLIPRITERTEYYRQFITEKQWNDIVKRHKDLELEKGYFTQEVLAEMPTVSILITVEFTIEQLDMILGGIYNQQYQRFEVLIPKKYEDSIADSYGGMLNLRFVESAVKEEMLKESRGKYVAFVEDYGIYTKSSLLNMAQRLENAPNLDFVSMLMKNYDGEEYAQIPCFNASYGYTKKSKTKADKLTECDTLFSNKLFRKESLEDFNFTENPVEDIRILYRTFSFEKMRKGVMITNLKNEEFLSRCGYIFSDLVINVNSKKNNGIQKIIEKMKHHINKNDIEQMKMKLKLRNKI